MGKSTILDKITRQSFTVLPIWPFWRTWGNSEKKWYFIHQTLLSDISNIEMWLYNVSENSKVWQLISLFESVIEKLDLIALYLSFCLSYFNLLYPNLISAPISIILFQLLNTLYIIAMWEGSCQVALSALEIIG